MKRITPFIGFLIVNCLLVYLANQLLPENFVLGNARLTTLISVGVAGLLVTLGVVVGMLVLQTIVKTNRTWGGMLPMIIYFWVVNFVAVWVVARLAEISGLGISKFTYAAGWALAADAAQWGVWSVLGTKESVNKPSRAKEEEEGEVEE